MAHEAQGELVRSWRRHVGLSQAEVAAHLHSGKAAICNYESAERDISFEAMRMLDDCFGAGGALFDMAQALGTPRALPARENWVFHPDTPRPVVAAHFGADHGPAGWVLLRPQPGRGHICATVSFGPLAFEVATACGDDGIFVQLPKVAWPATVVVRLHEPGWVDQGRSDAPRHLGQPVFTLTGRSVFQARAGAGRLSTRPIEVDGGSGVLSVMTPSTGRGPRLRGEDYRRLRKHRCFVLKDVARWATALLPDEPVSVDTIRRLERGGTPRCRYLRARLDIVYETGGCYADEPVAVHGARERFELTVVDFWVGPVWFELLSDEQPCAVVHLRQEQQVQAIRVVPGACVTAQRRRRSTGPYIVTCPRGWRVRAGLGTRPGAPTIDLDPYGSRPEVA